MWKSCGNTVEKPYACGRFGILFQNIVGILRDYGSKSSQSAVFFPRGSANRSGKLQQTASEMPEAASFSSFV